MEQTAGNVSAGSAQKRKRLDGDDEPLSHEGDLVTADQLCLDIEKVQARFDLLCNQVEKLEKEKEAEKARVDEKWKPMIAAAKAEQEKAERLFKAFTGAVRVEEANKTNSEQFASITQRSGSKLRISLNVTENSRKQSIE